MYENPKSLTNSLPPLIHRRGFTIIGPKDHDRNVVSGRKRTHRAAFTLIELIVVMAVIGVLVLLAAPKFLNYTARARETHIRNDIKVLESKIDEYIIKHDSLPTEWGGAIPGDGQLYDRKGKINSMPSGDFKVVDKTFYPETNLGGDFYADANGEVVYEDNNSGENGTLIPENPVYVEAPEESETDIPLGSGTETDPYQIWFLEHLAWISTNEDTASASYTIMRDLDFNDERYYLYPSINKPLWTTNEGWTPIQVLDGEYPFFLGILDGQNFNLFNLYINRPSQRSVGLFSYVGDYTNSHDSTEVKRLNILDASIVGGDDTGTIAGSSFGLTITDVTLSGAVEGNEYVGGAIGSPKGGEWKLSVINVSNYSIVSGNKEVGGIFGGIRSPYILDKVTNKSSVNGNDYVGGIAGAIYATGELTNVTNDGDVLGKEYVGGIAGIVSKDGEDKYKQIWSNGLVQGTSSVGGVFGELNSDASFIDIAISADVSGTETFVGGFIGQINASIVANKISFEGDISGKEYTGGIVGEMNSSSKIAEVSVTSNIVTTGDYTGGIAGIANDSLIIETGLFNGNINGMSFVGGLAGETNGVEVVIMNELKIIAEIFGIDNIGGFTGWANSVDLVEAFHFDGQIEGNSSVGGVYGSSSSANSSGKTTIDGLVTGLNNVGGIVGEGYGVSIENSIINANISAPDGNNVGGILGLGRGNIINNEVYGAIDGKDYVGGIVGSGDGNTLTNNTVNGTIDGNDYIGGMIGYGHGNRANDNVMSGEIAGNDYVGGIISSGYSGEFYQNEVSGIIKGRDYIGGIMGLTANGASVSRNKFIGEITGNDDVGGIIGRIGNIDSESTPGGGPIPEYNYSNGIVRGQRNIGGIIGYARVGTNPIGSSENHSKVFGIDNVGGIIGFAGMFPQNSVNYGAIEGEVSVGGIIGEGSTIAGPIQYVINHGLITGIDKVGGLAGSLPLMPVYHGISIGEVAADTNSGLIVGRIENMPPGFEDSFDTVYYIGTNSIFGIKKTPAELKESSFYRDEDGEENWSTSTWKIVDGHYPELMNMPN